MVRDGVYFRTFADGKLRGWISVGQAPGRDTLHIEVSGSLAPALRTVIAAVKRVFDLAASPRQIAEHLGTLAVEHPGLRVPGAFNGFEMAVRAILGQQISVAAAATLASRYHGAFGEPIETPFESLSRLSALPERIAAVEPAELVKLGILKSRANTIISIAQEIASGRMKLTAEGDVSRTISALKELPGIGEWTAQYIAMRALGWPDAFPHTDLGIMKALGERSPQKILQIAEPWRPWRSYATIHLWKSLEKPS